MFFQPNSVYVHDGEIYDFDDYDEFAGIGSFFKKIAKVVAPIAVGFIPGVGSIASPVLSSILGGSGGGGSGGGKVKGANAVNELTAEVMNQLRQIKTNIASDPEGLEAQAHQIGSVLFDASKVDQNVKKKDRAALDAAQKSVLAFVQEIHDLATIAKKKNLEAAAEAEAVEAESVQQAAAAGYIQLPNGQFVPANTGGNSGGVDMKTLLIILGCFAGVVIVTR